MKANSPKQASFCNQRSNFMLKMLISSAPTFQNSSLLSRKEFLAGIVKPTWPNIFNYFVQVSSANIVVLNLNISFTFEVFINVYNVGQVLKSYFRHTHPKCLLTWYTSLQNEQTPDFRIFSIQKKRTKGQKTNPPRTECSFDDFLPIEPSFSRRSIDISDTLTLDAKKLLQLQAFDRICTGFRFIQQI